MAGEHVQSIIDMQLVYQAHHEETDETDDDTDGDGRPRQDIPGGRGDGDQAHNRSHEWGDSTESSMLEPAGEEPDHHCGRCAQHGVDPGTRCDAVGGERAAAVETEPSEPKQSSTQSNIRDVAGRE